MAKTGYTEESEGVKSSTRLGFLSGIYGTFVLAGYMVYLQGAAVNPISIGIFIGAGIAASGGAKFFGTKNETPTDVPK